MKTDKNVRDLLAAVGATTLILSSSLPAAGGEPAQNPGTTPSAAEVGSRAGKKCAGMRASSPAEVGSWAGKKCAGMRAGMKCGAEVPAAQAAPAPYLQGRAALLRGNTAAAKELFQKAIAVSPEHAESYFQLATCQLEAKDFRGAKTCLSKYLELAPKGTNSAKAQELLKARDLASLR